MTAASFAAVVAVGLAFVFIVCWALEEDDVRRWHDFMYGPDRDDSQQ